MKIEERYAKKERKKERRKERNWKKMKVKMGDRAGRRIKPMNPELPVHASDHKGWQRAHKWS